MLELGAVTVEPDDESPFSFSLLSDVHSVVNDLNGYLEFSAAVEQLFEERDSALQRNITEIVEQIPDNEHDELIDSYAWDLHQNQSLFPSMHRESMFITLYNFLEHNTNAICLEIGKELKSTVQLKHLHGSGIERAFLFLKLVPGFEFKNINEEMSFIRNANKLRNVVVHNGGVLPLDEKEKVNLFVQSQASLSGLSGRPVQFDQSFTPLLVEKLQVLFREIGNEMQRFMEKHRT